MKKTYKDNRYMASKYRAAIMFRTVGIIIAVVAICGFSFPYDNGIIICSVCTALIIPGLLYQDRFGNLPRLGIAYRSCDNPSGGVRELRGFKKVRLEAGEETEVSIELDRRAFEYYSPKLHKWVVEGGRYVIEVGRSAKPIWARANCPST